jgi:hypothetical protein
MRGFPQLIGYDTLGMGRQADCMGSGIPFD